MQTQTDILQDQTLTAEINLYYDLYVKDERSGPQSLLIACHGYGENKRHGMRVARECAPDGFVIASLQGFYQHIRDPKEEGTPFRFGFGWLTNFKSEESVALHHKFVLGVIAKLINENIVDGNRIFLMGFSQTCALNFRFAFTHADILRGVVGICGGIPGDWDKSAIYKNTDADVLYLHGIQDEIYTPERVAGFESKLKMRANKVETKAYDAGHEISSAMRQDIKVWLDKQR